MITQTTPDLLDLLDWKRRIFELYAEVRRSVDPPAAWDRWRAVRDELFESHPQSPISSRARAGFGGLSYFGYDPDARVLAEVSPSPLESVAIGGSAGESFGCSPAGIGPAFPTVPVQLTGVTMVPGTRPPKS